MNPTAATAIRLCYQDRLTQRQIAERLGLPASEIKALIADALRQLSTAFAETVG